FLSSRDGDKGHALYGISVDGGEATRLFGHESSIKEYAIHPDGKRLVFTASEKDDNGAGTNKTKGFNQEIYEEQVQATTLWFASLDTPDAKAKQVAIDGAVSEIAWSPDGMKLSVAIAPSARIDDHYMARKVHVLSAAGKVLARVDNPGKMGQVAWSPDSSQLAIISAADLNDPRDGRILIVSASGGKGTMLLGNWKGHVQSIAWRDPSTVVFIGAQGTGSIIAQIPAKGGEVKHLAGPRGTFLTKLSLANDGRSFAAVGESPAHPREPFRGVLGKKAKKLTDHNPWIKKVRMAKQEVIRHNAKDGLELEGILIWPLDYKEGTRYPLVLQVHGGPESFVPNGWLTGYSHMGQVGAARGFAVFYPNYRGSTGRGVAFSKLGQADAAGKEFDDLVDAVDHFVSTGLADTKRVGITGGSYGGYASAWGATKYSDRFAASVMFVGISDKISKAGTTDIPNEEFLVHARKRMWDDWQWYLERSPIFHVKNGKTPTLILHGKKDTRVHPSQSMALYRHLKVLGKVPVRLVFYPDEGHGNRNAASRLDYNLRLLRWMERYLKRTGDAVPKLPKKAINYKASWKATTPVQ
ncbi:MAG: dipeptidyl aminopeptidase/acylaminoacyl peptidase, partial [Myxococcota bacterium]